MAQQVTRRTFVRGLGGAAAATLVARGFSAPRRATAASSGRVRFVWREADRLGLDSIFTAGEVMPALRTG